MKKRFYIAFATAIALALIGLALAQSKGTITVDSKLDAEGRLLGSMIRLSLEQAGFTVNDKTATGSTLITRKALTEGQIDIYPEYTGTAINNFFKGETIPEGTSKNAEKSYRTVKALDKKLNNIVWLARAPANNTWAIATTKTLSQKEGIKSLEDFAKYLQKAARSKLLDHRNLSNVTMP